MLVNRSTQPSINDIVTIKLVSGEEIVGKLSERQVDSVTLAKPIWVRLVQVGPTDFAPSLHQLLTSVPDPASLQFPLAALSIRPVKCGADLAESYKQATSSIILPESQRPVSLIQ